MKFGWCLAVLVGCSAQQAAEPTLAGSTSAPTYNRSDWGAWWDADKDCQDTRQEVLIAESETPVTFTDDRKCRVATGLWKCRYTGLLFTDPSKLDVDHMVPLKAAHDGGAWEWPTDKKRAFFNDLDAPEALNAVSAGSNRSKGDRTPMEWMPAENRCQYLKDWVSTKRRWNLPLEQDALITLFIEHCR